MTEQEMLQALSKMLDAQKQELSSMMDEKISSAEQRIMKGVSVLMDAVFKPRFDLLSEELETIKDRLPVADILDELQDELAAYRLTLRKHGREIQALQKAVNN